MKHMKTNMDRAFLSYSDLAQKFGRTKQTIARWVRQGLLPQPREIAPQVVGWVATDIDLWLSRLPVKQGKKETNEYC
jgi:predicted DNA-binding transcriptional regulator AlpA